MLSIMHGDLCVETKHERCHIERRLMEGICNILLIKSKSSSLQEASFYTASKSCLPIFK